MDTNRRIKFKMFEKTNYENLKNGEKYKIINSNYSYNYDACFLFFMKYDLQNEYAIFREIIYYNKWMYKDTNTKRDNNSNYYRYVSEEEYNTKRKDKYNQTVLNTILKKLINEEFEWQM